MHRAPLRNPPTTQFAVIGWRPRRKLPMVVIQHSANASELQRFFATGVRLFHHPSFLHGAHKPSSTSTGFKRSPQTPHVAVYPPNHSSRESRSAITASSGAMLTPAPLRESVLGVEPACAPTSASRPPSYTHDTGIRNFHMWPEYHAEQYSGSPLGAQLSLPLAS